MESSFCLRAHFCIFITLTLMRADVRYIVFMLSVHLYFQRFRPRPSTHYRRENGRATDADATTGDTDLRSLSNELVFQNLFCSFHESDPLCLVRLLRPDANESNAANCDARWRRGSRTRFSRPVLAFWHVAGRRVQKTFLAGCRRRDAEQTRTTG